MASRLLLLRHAKAGWALPGMRDFDRPLDASGVADANATGLAMHGLGYVPDLTLCSTAARARQTLEGIAAHTDIGRISFLDSLYSEDAAGYLQIIRKSDAVGSLLVIGHNPMLEDLASAIAVEGEDHARTNLQAGFPTCGLAVISFADSLTTAAIGKGFLEAFLMPTEL